MLNFLLMQLQYVPQSQGELLTYHRESGGGVGWTEEVELPGQEMPESKGAGGKEESGEESGGSVGEEGGAVEVGERDVAELGLLEAGRGGETADEGVAVSHGASGAQPGDPGGGVAVAVEVVVLEED